MSQPTTRTTRLAHSRVSKPKIRPVRYSGNNPHKMNNSANRAAYIKKYLWQPACGPKGLPTSSVAEQARIDRLFTAMTDFSDVWDSDNAFTEGRLIDNDDIEFTCLRIAHDIDKLHRNGICVPHVADPTMKEVKSKREKIWRIDQDERDLTPAQREDAIVAHLKHYKKACLDAIDHDKDLTILFIAAPISAGKKRDSNASSNARRKRQNTNNHTLTVNNNSINGATDYQDLTSLLTPQSASSSKVWPPVHERRTRYPVTANAAQGFDFMPYFGDFNIPSQHINIDFCDSMLPLNSGTEGVPDSGHRQIQSSILIDDQLSNPTPGYDFGTNWIGEGDIFSYSNNAYSSQQTFHNKTPEFLRQ